MLKATLLGTAILVGLSGCARISDSRFNPVNWFASSQSAPVTATGEQRPLVPARTAVVDARALVQSVTSLSVDRAPTGAIVRAVGVAQTQGYFNAELVNNGVANGVLSLEFRAQMPTGFQAVGSTQSREINAAYIIDATDIASIRTVRVQAATNARTSAR